MTSLLDWGSGGDISAPRLSELILGTDPRMTLLFTSEFESVSLHYVSDPSAKKYGICPGTGCPICGLGGSPAEFALLPVFDIESGEVKVLRISSTRGPTSLRSVLARHLADPLIADKVVFLRRENYAYTAEARPLAAGARRGEFEIRAFLAEQAEGLSLSSTFWRPSASELCELQTIRAKLDAIGGLPSSTSDAVPF